MRLKFVPWREERDIFSNALVTMELRQMQRILAKSTGD